MPLHYSNSYPPSLYNQTPPFLISLLTHHIPFIYATPRLPFPFNFLFPFRHSPLTMAPPTVELDLFAINNNSSSNPRLINRQRSFRDIQSAISKINPEVLRSVIACGSANQEKGNERDKSVAMPLIPKEEKTHLTALPLYPLNPVIQPHTAPLTIFYNGAVAVFDVPRNKAETILKIAEKGTSRAVDSFELKDQRLQLIETLEGDLPIARRKSLERFLEKRKERLTSISPYYCIPESRV